MWREPPSSNELMVWKQKKAGALAQAGVRGSCGTDRVFARCSEEHRQLREGAGEGELCILAKKEVECSIAGKGWGRFSYFMAASKTIRDEPGAQYYPHKSTRQLPMAARSHA
jgi:hypothetical protein